MSARTIAVDQRDLPFCSTRLLRWFAIYLRRYAARHFTGVRLSKSAPAPSPETSPLVIYSNHPSWWDPIVYFVVSDALFPGRPGYGPMDAEALARYGIFKRLGVFGVEAGSLRGAARFLRCCRAALTRPGAILWLTAEGRFSDPRVRPLHLAPGLAHLLRSVERATVVPLAIEYSFWNERHPEALLRFGDPVRVEDEPPRTVESWQTLLEERLQVAMDRLADDAQSREPARFDWLLRGRTGIGGVYDLVRRLRAALRGERFRASHGDEGS